MPQTRWDSRSRAKDKPPWDLYGSHQLLSMPETCRTGDIHILTHGCCCREQHLHTKLKHASTLECFHRAARGPFGTHTRSQVVGLLLLLQSLCLWRVML